MQCAFVCFRRQMKNKPNKKQIHYFWHFSLILYLLQCFVYPFHHQEDLERTQLNVLAVQAITSLVLSAMTLPTAGNPAVSCLEQQPRNKSLKALETRYL